MPRALAERDPASWRTPGRRNTQLEEDSEYSNEKPDAIAINKSIGNINWRKHDHNQRQKSGSTNASPA